MIFDVSAGPAGPDLWDVSGPTALLAGDAAPDDDDGPVAGTFSLPSVLIYVGEDCSLLLTGLSYTDSGGDTVYLNDADCDYVLRDAAGTAVSGGSGTLVYSGTDGRYEEVIDAAVTGTLTEGGRYAVTLTIREGERDGYRRLETIAEVRGGA
ncbi:MAG TPA: hypothetical protein VM529_14145 [Gemmata sp.]|nr:hypothetical protein [Gemmata sp.]